VHARTIREVAEAALAWGARPTGVVDSGLPGPKGNREFLLHLTADPAPTLPDELDDWIAAAVA
jgi:predicted rRNA methylase YqxC with S4 and FtsJ domains